MFDVKLVDVRLDVYDCAHKFCDLEQLQQWLLYLYILYKI